MAYQIRNWKTGDTIHEYGETVKECLENGVANNISFNYAKLNDAKLNYAKLNYAKLNGAKLNYAKLNYAELNGAKLNDAELNGANTHSVKYEFFGKLALQFDEIAGLRAAIVEGRVDGSSYEGECACFVGTLANVAHKNYQELTIKPQSNSLTEKWFLAISAGDTPETNPVSKIALDWIDEFLAKTNVPARILAVELKQ